MARRTVAALALALAGAAVFGPAVRFGFVFDDSTYILNNAHLRDGLTPTALRWAFTSLEAANWHPVTWLSHLLDVSLFGLDPRGHHVTSVVLHLASGVLLLLVLERMTGMLWRSALVAALFLLHPLRVESVAWVAERKDTLCVLFGILTLAAYLRHLRRPSAARFALVVAMFTLGVMAKPMLVTLPLGLLLLDYWPLGRLRGGALATAAPPALEKLPLLAVSAAASAVTLAAQTGGGALFRLPEHTLSWRTAHVLVSYQTYLARTLWPSPLAVFYPLPESGYPVIRTALAALAIVGVSAGAILARRRAPFLATGWLWFLVTLLPVIGVLKAGMQATADRYTYLPHVGLFLAAVWGGALLLEGWRPRARAIGAAACLLLLLALGLRARDQLLTWRDEATLYRHAARVIPGNWVMHLGLAKSLARENRLAEAVEAYLDVVRLQPRHAEARFYLATLLMQLGRFTEATEHFRAAVLLEPGNALAHRSLGALLERQGRHEEAIRHYREALRLTPGDSFARALLEGLLARQRLPTGSR